MPKWLIQLARTLARAGIWKSYFCWLTKENQNALDAVVLKEAKTHWSQVPAPGIGASTKVLEPAKIFKVRSALRKVFGYLVILKRFCDTDNSSLTLFCCMVIQFRPNKHVFTKADLANFNKKCIKKY